MSQTPLRLALLSLASAAALCACSALKEHGGPPLAATPTQQYKLEAHEHPDEIRIAAHHGGLSEAQTEALTALADRWSQSSAGRVVLQLPRAGADPRAVSDTGEAARELLISLGVPAERVQRVGYDPDKPGPAPIVVGFLSYEAVIPTCGREWENLTNTFSNKPGKNFGCAVTANMAAQIANPGDIVAPRELEAADAQRRGTIIDKYRKGETTSSSKDAQASGTMSTAGSGGGN